MTFQGKIYMIIFSLLVLVIGFHDEPGVRTAAVILQTMLLWSVIAVMERTD